MLRVIRPTGVGAIVVMPDMWLPLGNYSNSPCIYEGQVPAFYAFPSSDGDLPIKGEIRTSPSDVLDGENDCFHINYEGTILPVDQLSYKYAMTDVSIYYDYYLGKNCPRRFTFKEGRVNGTYYTWSHLLEYGDSYYYSTTCKTETGPYWNRNSFIGTSCCATEMVDGVQVAAVSVTTAAGHTLYKAYCFDFDVNRGFRIVNLAAGPGETSQLITDPHALIKFVSSWSYAKPQGAYSWAGCVPATGLSTSGWSISEDLRLLSTLPRYAQNMLASTDVNWSDLSYKCVVQTKTWDGNGIALAHDLFTLREQVSSVFKLVMNMKNPKSWASLFLSTKYGIPLTIRDIRTLIESLRHYEKRSGPRKVSSSTSQESKGNQYEYHYAIYFSYLESYLNSLSYKLSIFDLAPDYTNMWDLIPFSFVVDWFVDVGNLLDHIEAANMLSSFDIYGTISSEKITRSCHPSDLGFPRYVGNIALTKYTRFCSHSVIPPSIAKDNLVSPSFDHWIEGGALIIQKILN